MSTVDSMLAKAERACRSARLLLAAGDVDGACNRAYYAAFDAARAAIHEGDISRENRGARVDRTHRGVHAAFGEQMIKSQRLPKDIGQILKRLEGARVTADYQNASVRLVDAEAAVDTAERFVKAVREELSGRNSSTEEG